MDASIFFKSLSSFVGCWHISEFEPTIFGTKYNIEHFLASNTNINVFYCQILVLPLFYLKCNNLAFQSNVAKFHCAGQMTATCTNNKYFLFVNNCYNWNHF